MTAGWLAPLLFDLGGDVTLVQHVDPIPTAKAVTRLRAQRVVQTSVAQARLERGAISDPAEQLDLASAEEIAQAVAAGEEALLSRRPVPLPAGAHRGRAGRPGAAGAGPPAGPGRRPRRRTRWEQRAASSPPASPTPPTAWGAGATLDTTTLAMSFPFLSRDVGTRGRAAGGGLPRRPAPVRLDLWARGRAGRAPACASSPPRAGQDGHHRAPGPAGS